MNDLLDVEWTDPTSIRACLEMCAQRQGTHQARIVRHDSGEWWLEIDAVIPVTSTPLLVRYRGGIESYVSETPGRTVIIELRSRIEGHSYHVPPERAKEFSAFLDRDPSRANFPEGTA